MATGNLVALTCVFWLLSPARLQQALVSGFSWAAEAYRDVAPFCPERPAEAVADAHFLLVLCVLYLAMLLWESLSPLRVPILVDDPMAE